ncbi:hypothetical protein ID866_9099 [Astraeus odoratus]|nr:hypothetical protein ID866_9099 [Astraeus odoratus]
MVRAFDPHAFSVDRVVDPVQLDNALDDLEQLLAAPDTDVDKLARDLLSVPDLFGFIMAVWPGSARLVERIMAAFPTSPALISESFARALLLEASRILLSVPPDCLPTDSAFRRVGQERQYIEHVFPVLATLYSADFTRRAVTDEDLPEPEDDDMPFLVRKKEKRKIKRETQAIDATPFYNLGILVPASNEEAADTAEEIRVELRRILHLHLTLLSCTELAAPLRNAYIHVPDIALNEQRQLADQQAATVVVEAVPSTPPVVQPMKAILGFGKADKFGEWKILIGTQATKRLEKLRKNEAEKCKIVVKKIKDLSHGRFSDDNQERVDGVHDGVPIFEAKTQCDFRLVYQIDCVPDYDAECEQQGSFVS